MRGFSLEMRGLKAKTRGLGLRMRVIACLLAGYFLIPFYAYLVEMSAFSKDALKKAFERKKMVFVIMVSKNLHILSYEYA